MYRLPQPVLLMLALSLAGCTRPTSSPPEKSEGPTATPNVASKSGKGEKDAGTTTAGGLPADIVKAWTGAQAREGWMRLHETSVIFRSAFDHQPGDVPAFQIMAANWKDDVVAKLPQPPVPFGLSLAFGVEFTPKTAKVLASFDNLQMLTLSGSTINDEGVKELTKMKNLKDIDLAVTKVTGVGVAQLASVKSLEFVGASLCKLNDAELKELVTLPKLQGLNLGWGNLTDDGLKVLPSTLKVLNLGNTGMTDKALKEIARSKGMQQLVLGSLVSELADIKGLTQLRYLNVNDSQVGDAALKDLAGMTELEFLGLRGTKVTDAGLKDVAEHKKLKELYIGGTKTTDAGIAELKKALPECEIRR